MADLRFAFRGNAVGTGARLTRIDPAKDLNIVVPVQGACSLPVIGGESKAEVGPFSFSIDKPSKLEVLRFSRASTAAVSNTSGAGASQRFVTQVQSSVKDAAIIEKVKVAAASAAFTSVHGIRDTYPKVTPDKGSTVIDGLVLGNRKVTVTIDAKPFQDCPTKESLIKLYGENATFRRKMFGRLGATSDKALKPPETNGIIVGTIVEKIVVEGPDDGTIKVVGYKIFWEGVGQVILGEILISDFFRRLTMIRVELGSPIGGNAAIAEIETNGQTLP
jgi:hypothetical protein